MSGSAGATKLLSVLALSGAAILATAPALAGRTAVAGSALRDALPADRLLLQPVPIRDSVSLFARAEPVRFPAFASALAQALPRTFDAQPLAPELRSADDHRARLFDHHRAAALTDLSPSSRYDQSFRLIEPTRTATTLPAHHLRLRPHSPFSESTLHLRLRRQPPFSPPQLHPRLRPPAPHASPTNPGGQNHLFHGLWTDPVTGLAYARNRWYDPRNASWLSEDPAQDIDSPNLYAFVAHQPHLATDPMGLYAIDVHYYAVYFLARSVGFGSSSARQIAWSSQFVDEADEARPAPASLFDWHGYANVFSQDVAALHFPAVPGTVVQENSIYARGAVRLAVGERDLARVGIALHTFADSFSHAGFTLEHDARNRRTGSLRPNKGHADAALGGHAPDMPYLHQEKTMKMLRAMATFLQEAYLAIEGVPPNPLPETLFERDIAAAVANEQPDSTARSSYWQGLIELRFGEKVDFDPGAWPVAEEAWLSAFRAHVSATQGLFAGSPDPFELLSEQEKDLLLLEALRDRAGR